MKVKDAAIGKWFSAQDPQFAIRYITDCLIRSRDNVFWEIVEHYELRAEGPLEIGALVYEKLMDFELDKSLRTKEDL